MKESLSYSSIKLSEVVHLRSRHNLFKVSKGKAGSTFVTELCCLLE